MINREAIFVALFNLVSSGTGFQTKSRKLKHWNELSAPDMPAIFQTEGRMTAVAPYRQPTKWTLHAQLYIYARQNSLDLLPSTALNNLVDAVELKLVPGADGEQTLGGLVSHCRIVGDVETDEGVLGELAIAIIPIEIQANA
jgi:hypothetical protein